MRGAEGILQHVSFMAGKEHMSRYSKQKNIQA